MDGTARNIRLAASDAIAVMSLSACANGLNGLSAGASLYPSGTGEAARA